VPVVGEVITTTGGIISIAVYVTVNVPVEELPAASLAVTMIGLLPETREMPVIDHDVVPEAVPEVLLAELDQVTAVTPMLSEAVPDILIVELALE